MYAVAEAHSVVQDVAKRFAQRQGDGVGALDERGRERGKEGKREGGRGDRIKKEEGEEGKGGWSFNRRRKMRAIMCQKMDAVNTSKGKKGREEGGRGSIRLGHTILSTPWPTSL